MPYVSKDKRDRLDKVIELMNELDVDTEGELNYILYSYCKTTTRRKYSSIKSFIGELEECAAEIRRRILAPYEDEKILENGDIPLLESIR